MEILSINARIKALRKEQRLSQAEFGENIGLKQVAVSNLEKEGNTVTEQNVSLICQKFRVRREWLVDGEGEMYDSRENTLFSSFAKEFDLNEAEQNAARFLLTMPAEERRKMLHYVPLLADAIKGDKSQQKSTAIDIDAETAKFREELEAIQDAGAQGKQFPSNAISGEKEA